MEFDISKMHISHSFDKHPVLGETLKCKKIYLKVLEYFTLKYSSNDSFSLAMLDKYKKFFLGEHFRGNLYAYKELKLFLRCMVGNEFRGSKLVQYRDSLLFDCFLLNAFNDKEKAAVIMKEIKEIYIKKYHFKLEQQFLLMFDNSDSIYRIESLKYQVECWKKNCEIRNKACKTILTTATMSAGKSTLINALVGKTVNRTMNDACTEKLHHILDKAFEDNFNYELDYELNLDASYGTLINDNKMNTKDEVYVSTYFRTFSEKKERLCIIDTPGVNSSLNLKHAEVTKKSVLNKNYSMLIYVINSENQGTNDDLNYLRFIRENIDNEKVIFVLNKLDRFRINEDSITDSISNLNEELTKIGFENPLICPVSSYLGVLAKKMIFKENKTEDELDDYEFLRRKFGKEEYDLSKYYPSRVIIAANKLKKIFISKHPDEMNLLFNSGLLCLEHIIFAEVEV